MEPGCAISVAERLGSSWYAVWWPTAWRPRCLEAPALPLHLGAGDGEAGALRLGDLDGAKDGAVRAVVAGPVEAARGGHGHVAVILVPSHVGLALSTTQVTTGAVLGSRLGWPGAKVRWRVLGRAVTAWVLTLPAAALVAAGLWGFGELLGGGLPAAVGINLVLLAGSGALASRSRREPVHADTVDAPWPSSEAPPVAASDRVSV